jgi:uncharacterized protein (DUF433 family)
MSTLDWSQCPSVESIPGKVSGAWVFRGTRMPVATVFENLEAGASIEDARASHSSPRFCCEESRSSCSPLDAHSL